MEERIPTMSSSERVTERLEMARRHLDLALAELKSLRADRGPQAVARTEEYLSVRDLCTRIAYKEQTIRDLMNIGEFKAGVHFYKRRGRVMFVWSAMERWIKAHGTENDPTEPFIPEHHARSRKAK
jgi:hypothetical protein